MRYLHKAQTLFLGTYFLVAAIILGQLVEDIGSITVATKLTWQHPIIFLGICASSFYAGFIIKKRK